MKTLFFTSLLFTSSLFSANITIKITDILNHNGKLYIGLYNTEDNFSNISKTYKNAIIPINSHTLHYTFKNIPNGIYGISIFHDENENAILDKNFLGMPIEGYGFSNNARPTFRAANFEESQFSVHTDTNLTIKMGY